MAAQKPKVKMISFRLSAEEYALLRQAADAIGIANLSELARSAMHQVLLRNAASGNIQTPPDPAPGIAVEVQLRCLEEKLSALNAEFARLNDMVRHNGTTDRVAASESSPNPYLRTQNAQA